MKTRFRRQVYDFALCLVCGALCGGLRNNALTIALWGFLALRILRGIRVNWPEIRRFGGYRRL